MSSSTSFEYEIARLIGLAPNLIVIAIGAMMAYHRMPRSPQACRFLLAALVIEAFSYLGMSSIMGVLMRLISEGNPALEQNHFLRIILMSLPYSLVNAVVWSLVLLAMFGHGDRPADDRDRDILDR